MIAGTLINAAVFGTPVVVGLMWLVWLRGDRILLHQWRGKTLLVGMVAASSNAVMFYSYLVYSKTVEGADPDGAIMSMLGNYIGILLLVVALIGVVFGKGRSRSVLGFSIFMGLLVWLRPGV